MKSFLKPPIELRAGYKDPERMAALHELPCVVCEQRGERQVTKTEAHHLHGFGLGKKVSDLLSFPLCQNHHGPKIQGTSLHSTGLPAWESKFGSQKKLLRITNEKYFAETHLFFLQNNFYETKNS